MSIREFPTQLNNPEVTSLLKKYLTPDIFDQLKTKKSTRGITLWDCINSGIVNLDSGAGAYSGDEECYRE